MLLQSNPLLDKEFLAVLDAKKATKKATKTKQTKSEAAAKKSSKKTADAE